MNPGRYLKHLEIALNTISAFDDSILGTGIFFNRTSRKRKQEGEVRKCPVRKRVAGYFKNEINYKLRMKRKSRHKDFYHRSVPDKAERVFELVRGQKMCLGLLTLALFSAGP
jgi:hypothetical protein